MKGFYLLGLLLSLTISITAQIWCAPYAEWHYTRTSVSGVGYSKLTYAGTITVNAQLCQQINYFSEQQNPPSPTVNSYTLIPSYTRLSNNVVYLLNKNTNVFDTLYNYNAIPGSKWLLPSVYTNTVMAPCGKSLLTVIDTGHTIIQTVSLKWFKVQILKNNITSSDTLYERFGLLNNYFFQYDNCSSVYDYVEGGPLRCYNDNQIVNYKTVNFACNYLYIATSLEENYTKNHLSLYPNPVNSILNLQVFFNFSKEDNLVIEVVDISGRKLHIEELNRNEEKITLNLKELENGMYFVKVINQGLLLGVKQIIKE